MTLPPGWVSMTLDELQAPERGAITDGPFGSNLTSAHYTEAGPRVVRLQNIGDGVFVDAPAHISQEHFETLRKHEVRAGDLLVASLGETLPRVCLAPENLGPAIVKADCIRVRSNPQLVGHRYLTYWMQSPSLRKWASERVHGVGRPRLGLKTLRTMPVPIPVLAEQERIVEFLEDHLSRLDAAQHQLVLAKAKAKAWADGLTDAALYGRGYPLRPVSHLLREGLRNGHSAPAAASSDQGLRTLTLTAVTRSDFSSRYTKLTTADPRKVADLWLQAGDILVQRSNTPDLVGTSALYSGPDRWAIFPDLMIRVRCDHDQVSPQYLAIALGAERTHRALRLKAKGLAGSMPKIDQGAIASLQVPVPTSCEERNKVVAEAADADAARRRLEAAIEDAERRRVGLVQALLQAAFSGRLTNRIRDEIEELAGV